MSKSDVSFASAVESRTRGIYVEILRGNPALTLGELQELCRGEFGKVLGGITLGELTIEGKATTGDGTPMAASRKSTKKGGAKAPAKSAKPTTKKATSGKSKPAAPKASNDATPAEKPAEVNTRTPASRDVFDAAVFAAIQSIAGPAGAGAIQKLTGGTNMQVRSACNRLIEAGRLSWTGKARGTRYQVA